MSGSESFRIWADRAHRDSLRIPKPRASRYKCSGCVHKLTKNQAKITKGFCNHYGSKLRAYDLFRHI